MFAYMIAQTRAAERIGTIEDIADSVLLLASEKARWITGQHVSASGGLTGQ
jgi:NAD(P)-dependent dehydrogenase (short-subunit alcohol dehydrogenase family)